ncbi:MAG: A/G-specific adenine glycosylase [Sideroxydans sp.]|nr:A/G-specific adenine glycosylase [Sideroxydans sp.]
MKPFAQRVIEWQRLHGRHDLPWQGADAYHVWLSEIMLQQTQVATVIPYYQRFIASFPTIAALAAASEDEVLAHWSGLGYYARGRNLHRAAQLIMKKHGGEFPLEFEQIVALPGIGRSTAAAICALARHERRAILDGNVKRVLARHRGIAGWTGDRRVETQLWQQAEALLPPHEVATYIQGLMDLGATVCSRSRPKCAACPVQDDCVALDSERTAELPTPRPKKSLPEKHSTFVLLRHGNDILLEKRAASGIWGGLWCPPQFDDASSALAYCQQHFALRDTLPLPAFAHTFSHFRLHISPLLLNVERKPQLAAQPGRLWMELADALNAAIPAPVRMLLEELQGHRV